jgi:predicted nucleic acid-binding protein
MRFGDIAKDDIAAFFRFLDRRSLEVAPLAEDQLPLLVRDSNDTYLLSASFGGNANYLVSGDNDLLDLADDDRLGKLQIVSARDFLSILDRR